MSYHSRVGNPNSPLTPLLPLEHHQLAANGQGTRFGFSPITVNQLLAISTTPTVLKRSHHDFEYSPAEGLAADSGQLCTGSGDGGGGGGSGAIRKRYLVPINSPATKCGTPVEPMELGEPAATANAPRFTGHGRRRRRDENTQPNPGGQLAAQPTGGGAQLTPLSSTAVSECADYSSSQMKIPRLNDSALVANILADNNLGHLGAIIRREEIDLDVFCLMDRAELQQIGIAGSDVQQVLHIIQTLNRLYTRVIPDSGEDSGVAA